MAGMIAEITPLTAFAAGGAAHWGPIDAVLDAPLVGVAPDTWWISVLGFWLTLPLSLIQGIPMGLISCVFVCGSVGTCCIPCSDRLCSAMGSVLMGRPLYMAWIWWRYFVAGLVGLVSNGASRLALFMWEWQAFGSGRWWWHGEGVWCWTYDDCVRVLKSYQIRSHAFGCVRACCPDMFPTDLLIFLPGGPGTQWEAVRNALHAQLLSPDSFNKRMEALPQLLQANWSNPMFEQLNDAALLQRMVSKCVFFMLFGKWVTDEEGDLLAGWRTNAGAFVLPRIAQRVMCNIKIRQIKKLRAASVGLVEKYGLQPVFVQMNNSLGPWKKQNVVQLCDEIVFGIGFAGIGGTAAACETVAAFLQCKPPTESAAKHIKWGAYDTGAKMVAKYAQNPETYIREACRIDPPVTSATHVLPVDTMVDLAGHQRVMPAGMLSQYVLSMGNRDPRVFPDPEVFNPDRPNLNMALTWNGAFGAPDEASYPRICPGRSLSLGITTAVINHALRLPPPAAQPTAPRCNLFA